MLPALYSVLKGDDWHRAASRFDATWNIVGLLETTPDLSLQLDSPICWYLQSQSVQRAECKSAESPLSLSSVLSFFEVIAASCCFLPAVCTIALGRSKKVFAGQKSLLFRIEISKRVKTGRRVGYTDTALHRTPNTKPQTSNKPQTANNRNSIQRALEVPCWSL